MEELCVRNNHPNLLQIGLTFDFEWLNPFFCYSTKHINIYIYSQMNTKYKKIFKAYIYINNYRFN